MPKIFEIRKAGFENKGAAMMLIAATQQVQKQFPGARVVMAPDQGSPYEARARHGLWQRVELIRYGVDLGSAVNLLPSKLRNRFGFVTGSEVDVILDAACLAYSDQWGAQHTEDLAARAIQWKRAGKRLVLLPQAFGPFSSDRIRGAISTIADHADLIFARDKYSLDHMVRTVGQRDSIRLAPDFTNLLAAVPTTSRPNGKNLVAIVPNARMLDKTSEDVGNAYSNFLERVAGKLQTAGMSPFFLIHEGAGDLALAHQINTHFPIPLEIWVAQDAQEAKGLIGACTAMVGSRYHALISALSQGVPVIGTGWSHKYRALFEDYECLHMLAEVTAPEPELFETLSHLTDVTKRSELTRRMTRPAARIKGEVGAMWEAVFKEC